MNFHSCLGLSLLALASCGPQRQPRQALDNSGTPVSQARSAPPAAKNDVLPRTSDAAATKAPEPDNRTSLPEPRAPIDPKSLEAAGQVVQHYGALLEQRRLTEAAKLWGDAAAAASFARELAHPNVHMEIGNLGETEGAAGSIYTSVPVTFYGEGFRRPANVILRRVNDVPGSTEAQRRWHIERIEWAKV
jgi:hypothetical protein